MRFLSFLGNAMKDTYAFFLQVIQWSKKIHKNTQKKHEKTHPWHRCSNNLAQIQRESSPLLHGSSGYISSWLPCSSISHVEKNIKTLRPTQNPDTEPIHAKNNRFHSKILIFDNYPKSKTKKLTLLTCSYLFHNFTPKSYNLRYKSITKL